MRRTIIKIVAVLLMLFWEASLSILPARAMFRVPDPTHTPVLIIPGLSGTQIYKDSELLWPDIYRMLDPTGSDNFMDPLSFKPNLEPADQTLLPGSVIGVIKPLPPLSFANFDYTDALIQ